MSHPFLYDNPAITKARMKIRPLIATTNLCSFCSSLILRRLSRSSGFFIASTIPATSIGPKRMQSRSHACQYPKEPAGMNNSAAIVDEYPMGTCGSINLRTMTYSAKRAPTIASAKPQNVAKRNGLTENDVKLFSHSENDLRNE